MNRYQTSTPRTIVALAAAALTAVTLGLGVVVPAAMAPAGADLRSPAVAAAAAPTAVAIVPARIDVIGIREPEVAATQDRDAQPRRGRQG